MDAIKKAYADPRNYSPPPLQNVLNTKTKPNDGTSWPKSSSSVTHFDKEVKDDTATNSSGGIPALVSLKTISTSTLSSLNTPKPNPFVLRQTCSGAISSNTPTVSSNMNPHGLSSYPPNNVFNSAPSVSAVSKPTMSAAINDPELVAPLPCQWAGGSKSSSAVNRAKLPNPPFFLPDGMKIMDVTNLPQPFLFFNGHLLRHKLLKHLNENLIDFQPAMKAARSKIKEVEDKLNCRLPGFKFMQGNERLALVKLKNLPCPDGEGKVSKILAEVIGVETFCKRQKRKNKGWVLGMKVSMSPNWPSVITAKANYSVVEPPKKQLTDMERKFMNFGSTGYRLPAPVVKSTSYDVDTAKMAQNEKNGLTTDALSNMHSGCVEGNRKGSEELSKNGLKGKVSTNPKDVKSSGSIKGNVKDKFEASKGIQYEKERSIRNPRGYRPSSSVRDRGNKWKIAQNDKEPRNSRLSSSVKRYPRNIGGTSKITLNKKESSSNNPVAYKYLRSGIRSASNRGVVSKRGASKRGRNLISASKRAKARQNKFKRNLDRWRKDFKPAARTEIVTTAKVKTRQHSAQNKSLHSENRGRGRFNKRESEKRDKSFNRDVCLSDHEHFDMIVPSYNVRGEGIANALNDSNKAFDEFMESDVRYRGRCREREKSDGSAEKESGRKIIRERETSVRQGDNDRDMSFSYKKRRIGLYTEENTQWYEYRERNRDEEWDLSRDGEKERNRDNQREICMNREKERRRIDQEWDKERELERGRDRFDWNVNEEREKSIDSEMYRGRGVEWDQSRDGGRKRIEKRLERSCERDMERNRDVMDWSLDRENERRERGQERSRERVAEKSRDDMRDRSRDRERERRYYIEQNRSGGIEIERSRGVVRDWSSDREKEIVERGQERSCEREAERSRGVRDWNLDREREIRQVRSWERDKERRNVVRDSSQDREKEIIERGQERSREREMDRSRGAVRDWSQDREKERRYLGQERRGEREMDRSRDVVKDPSWDIERERIERGHVRSLEREMERSEDKWEDWNINAESERKGVEERDIGWEMDRSRDVERVRSSDGREKERRDLVQEKGREREKERGRDSWKDWNIIEEIDKLDRRGGDYRSMEWDRDWSLDREKERERKDRVMNRRGIEERGREGEMNIRDVEWDCISDRERERRDMGQDRSGEREMERGMSRLKDCIINKEKDRSVEEISLDWERDSSRDVEWDQGWNRDRKRIDVEKESSYREIKRRDIRERSREREVGVSKGIESDRRMERVRERRDIEKKMSDREREIRGIGYDWSREREKNSYGNVERSNSNERDRKEADAMGERVIETNIYERKERIVERQIYYGERSDDTSNKTNKMKGQKWNGSDYHQGEQLPSTSSLNPSCRSPPYRPMRSALPPISRNNETNIELEKKEKILEMLAEYLALESMNQFADGVKKKH